MPRIPNPFEEEESQVREQLLERQRRDAEQAIRGTFAYTNSPDILGPDAPHLRGFNPARFIAAEEFETTLDEGSMIAPTPSPRRISAEEESALMIARDRLESERGQRQNRAFSQLDEQAAEYRALIARERGGRYTMQEIVESEMPVCAESIDLRELVEEGGHQDVYSNRGRHILRCSACSRDIPNYFAYFCLGRMFCSEHVPDVEMCNVCLHPKHDTKQVTTFDKRDIRVCGKCLTRNSCRDCGERVSEAELEIRRCKKCRNRVSDGMPMRAWSSSMKYAETPTPGITMQTQRIFSAELELFVPHEDNLVRLSQKLPREMGVGTDGSLRGPGMGIELQTPRLAGHDGEMLIDKAIREVLTFGGAVNESCGFHIHVDATGILPKSRKEYPEAFIQLWKTHLIFEDIILSFVPFKRRLSRYSRPMRPYFNLVDIESVETISGAERLWYRQHTAREVREAKDHHYHSSRYFGINFHPLFSHGHLEVRYHPGTLNTRKVLEWANLHALIVDAAMAGKFSPGILDEANTTLTLNDKTNLLFNIIGLADQSRAYFYERQKLFREKGAQEEALQDTN